MQLSLILMLKKINDASEKQECDNVTDCYFGEAVHGNGIVSTIGEKKKHMKESDNGKNNSNYGVGTAGHFVRSMRQIWRAIPEARE